MFLKLHQVPLDKIFFVADTHFGHKMMARKREFDSIEAMDEALIANWNLCIQPDDHVFVIGDVSWYNADKTSHILERLNGIKYLIEGNHDWPCAKDKCRKFFKMVADRIELSVIDPESTMNDKHPKEVKEQFIVLDHYPLLSWNKAFHGSLHLFGHVHGRNVAVGKSMDVGVDPNNLMPVSYAEMKSQLTIKANHEKINLE